MIARLKVESSEYDSKIKRAAQGIQHLADACHGAGSELTYLEDENREYIKSLGNMETVAKSARGRLNELTQAFTDIKTVYNSLSETEKNSEFGKELSKQLDIMKGRISEGKQELNSINAELGNVKASGGETAISIDSLTSALGINLKSLTLWGAALGAGSVALDVLKDAFFNNEQQLDEWGRICESSESLYNGFLNALNTGDISGYLENIGRITEAARDAYDAMDALNTYNAFNQINVEKARTNFTEAISEFRGKKGTKEDVKTAADELKKELKDRQEKEQEAYVRAIYKIAAERGVPALNLEQALSGTYGTYEQLKSVMPTGKSEKYVPGLMPGQPGKYQEVAFAQTSQEKMGEALRALNDTELKDLQALGAQAQRTATEIAQIDKQLTRVLNAKDSGKTKGKTPQEKAQDKVAEAEHSYKQALDQAQMSLKNGTATEAEYKKKILAAEQRLWDAYGDAYQLYKNPKYKKLQDEVSEKILKLGGEVKASATEQEKAKKAAQELAAAEKKVTDALTEAAVAYKSNDLKGYMAAQKKVGGDVMPGIASGAFSYSQSNLEAFVANLKERLSKAEFGSDIYKNLSAQLADATALGNLMQIAIKNGIDTAQFDPQGLWKKIFGETPGDFIDDQSLQSIVDKINETLKRNGMAEIKLNTETGETKESKKSDKELQKAWSGVSTVMSGIQQIGIKIPQELQQTVSVIQGLMSVIQGIQTIISIFGNTSMAANTAALIANTAALNVNTGVSFLPGFAHGGVVHAANGFAGVVPGMAFSGDNIPIMANAGEVVLNEAQAGVLASRLTDVGGARNIHISGHLEGEQIVLAIDRHGRRSGKGELVFWKNE